MAVVITIGVMSCGIIIDEVQAAFIDCVFVNYPILHRKMISTKTLMSLRRAFQPKVNFLSSWGRSLATYGVGATVLVIYLIDWRVVVKRIPFYRQKFEEKTIE
ncbi:unnamed protein product [Hydatigera taeniaeformis]|uniref:ADP/ATP translocase n=1 Tax=Hydatigena taeniaeformis TaxID=6205 RepID=A0A0R3WIU5_HYDTA|nr:unnamed protein product [Hydatigera taeniaeformis]